MSIMTLDPIEKMLDAAENGITLIKNRDILHYTYIPDTILHRDSEQEQVTQSLIPILKHSRPSNLLVYGKPGTGKTLVVKKIISKTGKDIIYQLTRANERLTQGSLTLVGISNDLTFKERLDPRVLSSLGEEEIVFTNYSVEQIRKILEGRIEQALVKNAIEEAALNLCSAMAGREHGDARRAIDLLRVASEIAEREQKTSINEDHIRMAGQKIEENKEVTALQSYPLHEKILIIAVMKTSELSTGGIYIAYKTLCKTVRQQELTQRRVTQMLSEIEVSGLITGRIIHQGIHGRTKKYKLTISPDMIKETFKDDLTFEDIL